MISQILPNILSISLEMGTFLVLTCAFLDFPLHQKLSYVVPALIPILLCAYIETFFDTSPLSFLATSFLILFYLLFLTRESFLRVLVLYALEYSFIVLLEILLIPVFGFTANSINESYIQYLGLTIILLFSILFYFFVPLSNFYQLIIQINNTLLLLIGNAFVIFVSIVFFIRMDHRVFFQNYLFIILSVGILLFLNGEVYFNHSRSIMQKKQLESYQTYLPIIERLIDQIRENQHDYKNHIQSIRSLGYSCTDYDSLRSSLLESTEHYMAPESLSYLLNLNMHLVSGFLVSKCLEANQKKRALRLTVDSYSLFSKRTEYEIIENLGILIDNAIEATPADQKIYATLSSEHNSIVFKISNPGPVITADFCKNIFMRNYTTKQTDPGSHGIGLYKLHNDMKQNLLKLDLGNEEVNGVTYLWFQLVM